MRFATLNSKLIVLWIVGLAATALIFAVRMPQDPSYHLFADARTCLGIPNFLNVASNLAFLVVGIGALGWMYLRRSRLSAAFIDRSEAWLFVVLFIATSFVTFGSGYYHLAPDNARLFWDRLPMVFVSSAFVAIIFADRWGAPAGMKLGAVLLTLSLAGLVYWRTTIESGLDNVWPYYATVYGALIFAVVTMLLFPSRYTHSHAVWITLVIYSTAMAFDKWLDQPLYLLGGIISGHSFKHMLAALALFWLAWGSLRQRTAQHAGTF